MPGGRHGLDRRGRREQRSREAAEAERTAQVARAERRLAQATGSTPARPRRAGAAAPPARHPDPPLAPAPREPLPISGNLYVEEAPTDGLPSLRTERTLPPGTWLSFR